MDDVVQLNTTLAGRYAIEREIGSGGMATVYLARDVKHNRHVALKVLRPDLGAVLGVERFLSEISVTANLQHPNLLPLFDSGEAGGLLFYVMPFIEGETLRARLDREKQLPVDEAVRIATSIAGALDYAHRHKVIHRDLKPENILLHDGQPVVADFGIALAVSNAGAGRITQTGLSLGTPHYMSPEQATGDRSIDGRTDVYSLGAMTYEMLTGDPPHTGSTSQAVIARVLTEKPRSIRSVRPNVPEHVEAAVELALEKLPADRFATAREFSEGLTGHRAVTHAAVPRLAGQLATKSPRRLALASIPWILAAGASTVAIALSIGPKPEPSQLAEFRVDFPDSTSLYAGGGWKEALSPDGTQLALVGIRDGETVQRIYLRRLNDPLAQPLGGTENANSPAFSPDGRFIVFAGNSQLKIVPVGGGSSRLLADGGGSPSWTIENQIIYTAGGAVWVVSPDGGQRRQVSKVDTASRIRRIGFPYMLPGGTHALVTTWKNAASLDSARIGVLSIADGAISDLGLTGSNPRYAQGYLLFVTPTGELLASAFSLSKLEVTSAPAMLLRDVWGGTGGATGLAVSNTGVLVFHTGDTRATPGLGFAMTRVEQNGVEHPLAAPPRPYWQPRLSPDAKRIVVRVGAGEYDGTLWVHDIAAGTSTPLTTDSGSFRGEWTRDGSRVLYLHQTADSEFVLSRPWDLSAPSSVVARGNAFSYHEVSVGNARGWSAIRRGNSVVGRTKTDVLIAPTESLMATRPLLAAVADINNPRISPNGRLLAYSSNEAGTREVFITPLPGPGPRIPVSIGGGTEPAWSRDGKQLYYRAAPQVMMMATLSGGPEVTVTRRDKLFRDPYTRYTGHTNYDVFPDGSLLMLRAARRVESGVMKVYAVLNWQQLLPRAPATP